MVDQNVGITPELEEKGRGGDTEVGLIEIGSVVIPEAVAQEPELAEMFDSIKRAIKMQGQDPNQFTVTDDNELYAYNKNNAIPAHLTNGEFIIPVQIINIVPELDSQLEQLFTEVGLSYGEFKVGHPDNKINPNTNYPEFFNPFKAVSRGFKSLGRGLSRGLKSIGSAVKRGLDSVVDFGSNFVKSLGQGVEDLFEGDIKAVLENPAVIATASFMFPQYGAYINLGAKAATGQKITTSDLVAAGFQATTDFTKVKIDPNIQKAVTTAAQVSDGVEPVQALASNYGADWLDETGIGDNIKSGVASTIGKEYSDRVFNTIDLNQAVADYAAGNSTERILANQFGDDVVGYLGAESPSERALGFAGIETVVQKAEGASNQDALLAGAETYYNRGGQLPDVGQIASLAGIEDFDLGLNDFVANLGIDFPELQNLGYDLPSLASLGINLPSLSGIETPDLLSNFSLPEVAGLGFDIPSLDLSGFKPTDLGYDVGTWGQLKDLGVNIGDLDLSDYNLPDLANLNLDLQLPELDLFLRNQGVTPLEYGSLEMDESLLPEFALTQLEEEEEIPLSQQLLQARLT